MDDSNRSTPERRNTILTRTVTLERQGERLVPVAVCPRRLRLMSVSECGHCDHFAGLTINPSAGEPFMRCSFSQPLEAASDAASAELRVAELMTPAEGKGLDAFADAPVVVRHDAPAAQVAALMAYEHIAEVLVVDDDNKIVGTVTTFDFARWVACRGGYIVPSGR